MKPMTEEDMLELMQRRWVQAHRHQSSQDWHELMRLLFDMAGQVGKKELADYFRALSVRAYQRSLEFVPCDLQRAA